MSTFTLLYFQTLIQDAVFADVGFSAGNVISLFITIDTECICIPDSVYFEGNRLRKFFLEIVLHAVGNSNLMAFNISKDV